MLLKYCTTLPYDFGHDLNQMIFILNNLDPDLQMTLVYQ